MTGMNKITQRTRKIGDIRYAFFPTGIIILLISIALAACGSSTGSGGTGNATPTTQAQMQQCGKVQTNPRGMPNGETVAMQSEQCFYKAYQQCQNATMVYTLNSLDTTIQRTFTITNHNGQCTLTDAVQHSIAPTPLSPAKTFQCSGVAMQTDGLHFTSCGDDGNITVVDHINTVIQ